MKLNRTLSSVLGIIGAVAVPAAVLAQFQPQQRLTAASLNELAGNVVQVGTIVTAASLASNSAGAFTTTRYIARGDGIVTLATSGDAVARIAITAALEISGSLSTVWRTTGGNGATFTLRDGQRFSVGGQATGGPGQTLSGSINIFWTPLTADIDPPIVSN